MKRLVVCVMHSHVAVLELWLMPCFFVVVIFQTEMSARLERLAAAAMVWLAALPPVKTRRALSDVCVHQDSHLMPTECFVMVRGQAMDTKRVGCCTQIEHMFHKLCLFLFSATDEDECTTGGSLLCDCESGLTGCAAICNNIAGSYECSCNEGFYVDSDGKTCKGMIAHYQ